MEPSKQKAAKLTVCANVNKNNRGEQTASALEANHDDPDLKRCPTLASVGLSAGDLNQLDQEEWQQQGGDDGMANKGGRGKGDAPFAEKAVGVEDR